MSVVVDTLATVGHLAALTAKEYLNFVTRPVVLARFFFLLQQQQQPLPPQHQQPPFTGLGYVSGGIATASVGLLAVALFSAGRRLPAWLRTKRVKENAGRLVFVPWFVDGLCQLPGLASVFLRSLATATEWSPLVKLSAQAADLVPRPLANYPISCTGCEAALAVAAGLYFYFPPSSAATTTQPLNFRHRIGLLLFANGLGYAAFRECSRSSLVQLVLVGCAAVMAAWAVLVDTPHLRWFTRALTWVAKKVEAVVAPVLRVVAPAFRAAGRVIDRVVTKYVAPVMSRVARLVKRVFVSGWPLLRDFVHDVIAAIPWPALHRFQEVVLAPAWRVLSPLGMPTATASIVALTLLPALREGFDLTSFKGIAVLFNRGMCAAAAATSTGILLVHAYHRILRRQADPLGQRSVKVLRFCCNIITWPWRLLQWVVPYAERMGQFGSNAVDKTIIFSTNNPLISIPLVLTFNFFFFMSPAVAALTDVVAENSQAVWNALTQYAAKMSSANTLEEAADSVATVTITFGAQLVAYVLVTHLLNRLRGLRDATTGELVGLEERNAIAAAMDEPRQCGRCAFGPVDHTGCSNLVTHHGERHGSFFVNNACPRCGWMARNITAWPRYNGHILTPAGQAIFRQRVWGEAVVVVRAASKALVVPFAMMRIGSALDWSPSVAAVSAAAYLMFWLIENARAAEARNRRGIFDRGANAGDNNNNNNNNNRRHFRGNRRRRRRQNNNRDDGAGAGAGAGAGGENPDCGGARPDRGPLIAPSQALRNILEAVPERVHMNSGDVCSVCLEEFTAAAVEIADSENGRIAATLLLNLDPRVVALRCGHALHVECAEGAVAAAEHRHVRCPLCREPVSLSGAVGARFFN